MFQRYREKAPPERQAELTNITKLNCQLNPPTREQFVAATNDAQLNKTAQLNPTNYASHRRLVKQEVCPHSFTEFRNFRDSALCLHIYLCKCQFKHIKAVTMSFICCRVFFFPLLTDRMTRNIIKCHELSLPPRVPRAPPNL
jgi:hypothetical protein